MILNTEKLPDNPAELKKIIGSLNTSYSETLELSKNQQMHIKHLEEQVRLFRQKLFGRKSEKYIMPGDNEQMPLFDEIESTPEEAEEKVVTVPEHKRKKGGRKPLPDNLP